MTGRCDVSRPWERERRTARPSPGSTRTGRENPPPVNSANRVGSCIEGKEKARMCKYVCDVCGYVYDPAVGDEENGVEPGTAFEGLPDDWVCPLCGVGKEDFSPQE